MTPRSKSKTVATWLALIGGAVGLHRFYLHGVRDRVAWLWVLPTLVGGYGLTRALRFGQDDHLSWLLIPWLGLALAAAMLAAIVHGLTPDERWNARYHADGTGGWPVVIGVVLALLLGGTVLMSTLAYSAQRYFEYQAQPAGPRSWP